MDPKAAGVFILKMRALPVHLSGLERSRGYVQPTDCGYRRGISTSD